MICSTRTWFGQAVPILCGAMLALHSPSAASADASVGKWPERSITMITPVPPGGTLDIVARIYAPHLSQELGQPVIVDNRAGAGGSVATEFAARAQPNGYSVLLTASSIHAGHPAARKGLQWSPSDFRAVAMIGQAWYVFAATTKVPARNLKEFVAYAKANPGKLNYATLGSGSLPHIGGLMFNKAAGLDLVAIPYQGSGPATVDLISGVVQLMIVSSPPVTEPIKAGTLRGLAVASPERLSILPNVPTTTEEGFDSLKLNLWIAVMAPKDTPDFAVQRINTAMRKVAAIDTVKQRATQLGYNLQDLSVRELQELADNDVKSWSKILRDNNIQLE